MLGLEIQSNIEELVVLSDKNLTLKQSVLEAITEIVRLDIEQNLVLGRSFDGSSIAPKRKGGRIFYETGQLIASVKKRMTPSKGNVFIGTNRAEIARKLNYGENKLVPRPFFGISNRITESVNTYLSNKTFEETFEKGATK